jgi:acetate kinase
MAVESLTLIANPGSASRKYALFVGDKVRAQLHFEYLNYRVVCTIHRDGKYEEVHAELQDLGEAAGALVGLLHEYKILEDDESIARIGLRVVAPSSFFLENHVVDDEVVARLEALEPCAPLHISATLHELHALKRVFDGTPIVGISDSAFHITKPDYAWNYGLPLEDADRLEIKRYGYHGISVASIVRTLQDADKLAPKTIVCHLGSGASVTAVHGGKSVDNTMGYSPLEGIIMSTRSGTIDFTAVRALKEAFGYDDQKVDEYLNKHGGLLGLGGSADIRELLQREAYGDHPAHLALRTYVYSVQKAIGQMIAALGGVDEIVFTGTVGERSGPIRERITKRLHYLDFILDEQVNGEYEGTESVKCVSRLAHSKPVYVVQADEAAEMVRQVQATA